MFDNTVAKHGLSFCNDNFLLLFCIVFRSDDDGSWIVKDDVVSNYVASAWFPVLWEPDVSKLPKKPLQSWKFILEVGGCVVDMFA